MYEKQDWSDVYGETPFNADRMNHIEDGIYENSLDNVYSTEETFTGKYWIDGKKIYRKVIQYSNALTSGQNVIKHNISNINKAIKSCGYIPIGSTHYMFGAFENSTTFATINYINNQDVSIQIGSNWGNSFSSGCIIVLEYTKTTD